MTTLGKILLSLFPKTLTGAILCVVPIATAVVVVLYPKTIITLFLPKEQNELHDLLEEINESNSSISRGSTRRHRRRGGAKNGKAAINTTKTTDMVGAAIASSPSCDSTPGDEEAFLLRLATIKGMEKVPTTSIIQSPVLTSIPIQVKPVSNNNNNNTSSSNNDDDGIWNRVPTREEEANATLRNRVAILSKQCEESEKNIADLKVQLGKQTDRVVAAEGELKDRTRVYQLRWVEMESEISVLRAEKGNLLTRIEEIASLTETINQERAKIERHLVQIHDLEAVVATVPELKKKIATQEEDENQKRAQISHLEDAMFKIVEEKEGLRQMMNKQVTELQTEVESLKSKIKEQNVAQDDIILLKKLNEKRLVEAERDLDEARNNSSQLWLQIEELKGDLTQLEDQVKALSKEKTELMEQLADMVASIPEDSLIQKEAEELRKCLADTRAQLEERAEWTSKDELNKFLAAKDELISKLRAEKETDIIQLTLERDNMSEKLKEAETALEMLNARLNETESKLKSAEKIILETQDQFKNVQDDLDILRQSSTNLASQRDEKVARLEVELEGLKVELSTTKASILEKECLMATLRETSESLLAQINTLKADSEEKSHSLTELTTQLEQKNKQVELVRQEMESLKNEQSKPMDDQVIKLQEELIQSTAALDFANQTKKTMEINLERAEKRLRILETVNEQRTRLFESEIAELKAQKATLEGRLNDFSKSTDIIEQLVSESSPTVPTLEISQVEN